MQAGISPCHLPNPRPLVYRKMGDKRQASTLLKWQPQYSTALVTSGETSFFNGNNSGTTVDTNVHSFGQFYWPVDFFMSGVEIIFDHDIGLSVSKFLWALNLGFSDVIKLPLIGFQQKADGHYSLLFPEFIMISSNQNFKPYLSYSWSNSILWQDMRARMFLNGYIAVEVA